MVGTREFGAILAEREHGPGATPISVTRVCQLIREGRIEGVKRDLTRPGHPWDIPEDAAVLRPPDALYHNRKSRGITARELAEREGVTQRTILRWLNQGQVEGAYWDDREGWIILEGAHSQKNRAGPPEEPAQR